MLNETVCLNRRRNRRRRTCEASPFNLIKRLFIFVYLSLKVKRLVLRVTISLGPPCPYDWLTTLPKKPINGNVWNIDDQEAKGQKFKTLKDFQYLDWE